MSNKARKVANRMRVAELKQLCARPEVVEAWDVAAADPRLLVYLKSYRNTVPVPQHWCQKRAFLAGKRGLEKPPWQLPSFIEATGIQKLRDAYAEKEEGKKLKQKGKDATTAKMGKIDIDYQVLHDAFFKFQTKPKMTAVGEVYYEGKEYETPVEGKRPGWLSEETREALGVAEDGPPPWLINMQRYGPPPSYPHLKIPGVSAPIPAGAQFGYHPGGWGKPPVDALGRPIYGDVFGVGGERPDESTPYDLVLRKDEPWGALEDADESEDESEGESDEEGSLAEGSEPDAAEEAPRDSRCEEDDGAPEDNKALQMEVLYCIQKGVHETSAYAEGRGKETLRGVDEDGDDYQAIDPSTDVCIILKPNGATTLVESQPKRSASSTLGASDALRGSYSASLRGSGSSGMPLLGGGHGRPRSAARCQRAVAAPRTVRRHTGSQPAWTARVMASGGATARSMHGRSA